MTNNKHLTNFISTIPLYGGIIALVILNLSTGGMRKDGQITLENTIAIVVALIAVAGTLIGHLIQFKKDSQKIDGTRADVGNVKADTSEMKPQVGTINKNVEVIKDDVLRNIIPNMDKLKGVDRLVAEMEYQQRVKAEISADVITKDYFVSGIENLYIKIGSLEEQLKQEREKNLELMLKNNKLQRDMEDIKANRKNKIKDRGFER